MKYNNYLDRWELCDDLLDGHGHILIGGQTGSGKSVLLNDIMYNIMAIDERCSLVLVDPKKVELRDYSTLRNCIYYADDYDKISFALDKVIETMDIRFRYMASNGLKQIKEQPMFVIVDELADLMVTDKKLFLPKLQKIAQLGRAANVRLIVATQSPSRKVIPAELTLNFGTKIALHCDSAIESRQIINTNGAEMLPLYGEAIVKSVNQLYKTTVPYTTDYEIRERIRYVS